MAKKKIDLSADIQWIMSPQGAKELEKIPPALSQFLLRFTDFRDSEMNKDLKKYIRSTFRRDKINLCKEVTNAVCLQLDVTLKPMREQLEKLGKGQDAIIADIVKIKEDMETATGNYEDLKRKFDDLRKLLPDDFKDKFKTMEETLDRVDKRNKWKAILFRLAITALLTAIATILFIIWYHNHYMGEGKISLLTNLIPWLW
jgi:hypothetical protein